MYLGDAAGSAPTQGREVYEGRPVVVTGIPLPPGDDGVFTTVRKIRQYVQESDRHPIIRELALWAIRGNRPDDTEQNFRSIAAYAASVCPYVRDTTGSEYLVEPWIVGHRIASGRPADGDCDDASAFAPSLLRAIGIGPLFATVIANGRKGRAYNHVFMRAIVNGKVMELDPYTKTERKRVIRYADLQLA